MPNEEKILGDCLRQNVINQSLPLAFYSSSTAMSPLVWVTENKFVFEDGLAKYGAVLLRGFKKYDVQELEDFIRKTSGDLLTYRNRSTPRSLISGKIYTSTEYPADQIIHQHNESCYTHEWPARLFFCCITAAMRGGETPISDSRKVLKRIPKEIVDRFERAGITYLRTFTPGLGLTWQETFQISDRVQMQKYCKNNNIMADWLTDGRLRIRQTLQATAVHPVTGERVWFNQAHLFHLSSLPNEIRTELEKNHALDELPRNAFYGDGDNIDDETVDSVRQAYEKEESSYLWQEGDLLVIDNMLTAHGRKAFEGNRKIVVGMT
jgi:alpha-ketoglutarate-dependent taurine dioxygenase